MDRRSMLRLLASAPAAAGLTWTEPEAKAAHAMARQAQAAAQAGTAYTPKFFTPHEWDTVRVLVDIIIPKDAKSGSATDAAVPEFMDFIITEQELRQTAMRGGLAWLDRECQRRFDKTFLDCAEAERVAVLDDIAWPQRSSRTASASSAASATSPPPVSGPVASATRTCNTWATPTCRNGPGAQRRR
jgi:hypothetical protein